MNSLVLSALILMIRFGFLFCKVSNPFKIDGFNLNNKKLILATVHRRENWGENLKNIAYGLRNIIDNDNSTILLIPLHKNPKVRGPLKNILKGNKRIILTEPLDYDELISILEKNNFKLDKINGMNFNVFKNDWNVGRDKSVNYIAKFIKN